MKNAALEPKRKSVRQRYDRLEARVMPELKELLMDAATLRGVTLGQPRRIAARSVLSDAGLATVLRLSGRLMAILPLQSLDGPQFPSRVPEDDSADADHRHD